MTRKMISRRRSLSLACLTLAGFCLAACGCGGASSGREKVTGTVMLDGQPVAEGMVSFEPAPGLKTPNTGAVIVNGAFEIPAESGPMPGKYKVKVVTSKPTGKMSEGPGGMQIPVMEPVRINETAGVDVTIAKGQPNRIDLKVTSAR